MRKLSRRLSIIVQGQFRTLKDATLTKLGERIKTVPHEHTLVDEVLRSINRHKLSNYGKTNYERGKGHTSHIYFADFGENAWYLKSKYAGKRNYETRWEETIWF